MATKRARRAPARPRKRVRKLRVPKSIKTNNMLYVKRTAEASSFQITAAGWYGATYTFRLANLPNYTEFTTLFNQYKISAVRLDFFPEYTGNDLPLAGSNYMINPLLWTGADTDGTTTIVSQSAAMQNTRMKMVKNVWKPFSIYTRVKFQDEVSNDISGLNYAPAKPTTGWLDTQNFNIQHSGVQIAGTIPSHTSPFAYTCRVFATYYMQFKEAI